MLSRAIHYHKLYIITLLSLSLIKVVHTEQDKDGMEQQEEITQIQSIEDFDKNHLLTLNLEMLTKPPRSTKVIKKPSIFNAYWNDNVIFHYLENRQMNKQQSSLINSQDTPIQLIVSQFYEKNMHLSQYSMVEFPAILVENNENEEEIESEKNKRSSKQLTPKKRKGRRDIQQNLEEIRDNDGVGVTFDDDMEIVNSDRNYDLNNENNENDGNDVEIIDREEINRQTKRLRRHDDIVDFTVDQVKN